MNNKSDGTRLDAILNQFIAEYHQGLNELAGHGSAIDQAKLAIQKEIERQVLEASQDAGQQENELWTRGIIQLRKAYEKRLKDSPELYRTALSVLDSVVEMYKTERAELRKLQEGK